MSLVAEILTIIAGIIYIAYQAHKEHPGVLTLISVLCVMMFIGAYVIPQIIGYVILNVSRILGLVLIVLYIIAIIIGAIYWIFILPEKTAREEAKESAEIWKEVNALPEPDQDTLLYYRDALGLPRYPVDNKTLNAAARDAWRRDQYNMRMKKKHRFVVYL